MADEPTTDDASMPPDDGPDAFFGTDPDVGTGEFWDEADAKHATKGRHRRHRASSRAGEAGAAARVAAPTRPPKGIRSRIGAAWTAEASARRALRGRTAGTTGPAPSHRRRKLAAGIVGGVALLAVALAVTEATWREAATTDRADATAAGGDGPGSTSSSDSTSAGDQDRSVVESEIVDAPSSRPSTKRTRPAAAPTTTTPKATAADPVPTLPKPGSSGPSAPVPVTTAPEAPAPNAPTPTTAPPTPTTAAPRPPAAPTVQTFTAKAATSAGGACPPLQWATTFTWATSNASTVAITGLLETTLSNLPGDGSRVVCRLLPGGPLGGWTLTATGAGGSTTATA